jgi:hypothetical protein
VETDLERAATSTEINEQAQAAWAARPRRVAIAAYRTFEAQPGTDERGREARIALIGDADFLTDREYDTEANAELGLNLVRWLAGEELLIRREGEQRLAKEAMNLEPSQMQTVLALGLAVPIGVFLSGWIVWFFRRSK